MRRVADIETFSASFDEPDPVDESQNTGVKVFICLSLCFLHRMSQELS